MCPLVAMVTSHGAPRPRQMLITCVPWQLATAREPKPFRAHETDAIVSGISAPRETKINPKKTIGTPDKLTQRSTTLLRTKLIIETQIRAEKNVTMYRCSYLCPISQSG